MKKLNLLYRLKRFLTKKESGIVEKVEPAPVLLFDEKGKVIKIASYFRDHYGNLPTQVTFRNPLGELITKLTPETLKDVEFPMVGRSYQVSVYKTYKRGDEFP